jgi:hypothetical protein
MRTTNFEIRYPDGDFEFDVTEHGLPSIGETIRRKHRLWRVTRIAYGQRAVLHVKRATRSSESQKHPIR